MQRQLDYAHASWKSGGDTASGRARLAESCRTNLEAMQRNDRYGCFDPTQDPGSKARHACSLITKDEMEAILGSRLLDTARSGARCTYRPSPGSFNGATLDVEWEYGAAAMEGVRAASKNTGLTPKAVTGLGDEAFTVGGEILYIRKGQVFLTLNAPLASLEQKKRIAQMAVAKI
jgi:hypothetical protein